MNKQKILDSLNINLDETIAKVEKVMDEKRNVTHDSIEELIIDSTRDLAQTLTSTELAFFIVSKTIQESITEIVEKIVSSLTNKPEDKSNPLKNKLGF